MNRKIVIGATIFIMILLLANIGFQSVSLIDIEKSKKHGNDRWEQVEDRILQIENKTLQIEEKLEEIENIRGN